MLVVCTQDDDIREAVEEHGSGADAWGEVVLLPKGSRAVAERALVAALATARGPVCLSAHGNDEEIGDEGNGADDWGWNRRQVARLLARVPGPVGPVLVHACAENVSNFSAGLALALEEERALEGVWVYGYNRPVPATAGYPPPDALSRQVDLQGTQVVF